MLDLKEFSCAVNLLSAFHDDHCICLVMECCQGGTLQHLIQELHFHPMDVSVNHDNCNVEFETVVPFHALQMTHSVESTQNLGIYHNGICPSDILLPPQGKQRVTDF